MSFFVFSLLYQDVLPLLPDFMDFEVFRSEIYEKMSNTANSLEIARDNMTSLADSFDAISKVIVISEIHFLFNRNNLLSTNFILNFPHRILRKQNIEVSMFHRNSYVNIVIKISSVQFCHSHRQALASILLWGFTTSFIYSLVLMASTQNACYRKLHKFFLKNTMIIMRVTANYNL